MPFDYRRTIRFQDTDAAGVVYFADVLKICHEAYEESLIASGILLKSFFWAAPVAIPVVHANIDFLKPMVCGDLVTVRLMPERLATDTFSIHYEIFVGDEPSRLAGKALTRHVCINPATRVRQELPELATRWLNHWCVVVATEPRSAEVAPG